MRQVNLTDNEAIRDALPVLRVLLYNPEIEKYILIEGETYSAERFDNLVAKFERRATALYAGVMA